MRERERAALADFVKQNKKKQQAINSFRKKNQELLS